MKIPNRIYESIYKARTARITRQKVVSARINTNAARSSAHKTNGSYQTSSLSGTQSYLSSILEKNNASAIEKLAENRSAQIFYNRMQTAAGQVKSIADKLLKTEEGSIFEQEDCRKAKQESAEEIENFVNNYNILMGRLNSSSETTDIAYRKKLQDVVSAKKSELEEIGIAIGTNGCLELDENKLKEAELSEEKKLFYGTGSLGERVSNYAQQIYKYAKEQIQTLEKESYSLSTNYTRSGTSAAFSSRGYFNSKA